MLGILGWRRPLLPSLVAALNDIGREQLLVNRPLETDRAFPPNMHMIFRTVKNFFGHHHHQ